MKSRFFVFITLFLVLIFLGAWIFLDKNSDLHPENIISQWKNLYKTSIDTIHTPILTDFRAEPVLWKNCEESEFEDWGLDQVVDLECGKILVPMNYHEKNPSKFVTLALTRQKARSKNPIGSLLIIPGGPGQNSLDTVNAGEIRGKGSEKIKKNFDIIGFAPRGIFPSNPVINCGQWDENDTSEKMMQRCIRDTGLDFLEFVGSKEAVEDVNQIRIALGEEKISAIAYSYGTKVMAMYAEKYPKMVRAAVLDGIVNIEEDIFTMQEWQERGFQKAFEDFSQYCAEYQWCPFSKNKNPDENFHEILKNIESKNLTDTAGQPISSLEIIALIQDKLLWKTEWMGIIDVLEDLTKWETQSYNEHKNHLSSKSNEVDEGEEEHTEVKSIFSDKIADSEVGEEAALAIINCADSALSKKDRNPENYAKKWEFIMNLSTYDNFGDVERLDLCFYWPFDGKDLWKTPTLSPDLGPLLFVAQKNDPTTPYVNAEKMAKYFDSPLITREDSGHTVVFTDESACIDEKVSRFLLNPEKKQESATCL